MRRIIYGSLMTLLICLIQTFFFGFNGQIVFTFSVGVMMSIMWDVGVESWCDIYEDKLKTAQNIEKGK